MEWYARYEVVVASSQLSRTVGVARSSVVTNIVVRYNKTADRSYVNNSCDECDVTRGCAAGRLGGQRGGEQLIRIR